MPSSVMLPLLSVMQCSRCDPPHTHTCVCVQAPLPCVTVEAGCYGALEWGVVWTRYRKNNIFWRCIMKAFQGQKKKKPETWFVKSMHSGQADTAWNVLFWQITGSSAALTDVGFRLHYIWQLTASWEHLQHSQNTDKHKFSIFTRTAAALFSSSS